jgi:hypothetical protein
VSGFLSARARIRGKTPQAANRRMTWAWPSSAMPAVSARRLSGRRGPGRRLDDEHARVRGKGGTVRTVLLDDRGYATTETTQACTLLADQVADAEIRAARRRRESRR